MGWFGRHLLAVGFLLLGGAVGCRRAAPPVAKAVDKPELLLEQLAVQSYGPDGLEWRMTAPVGKVFTQKNLMQVSDMDIELFEKGQKSTNIKASEGLMRTGETTVPDSLSSGPLQGRALENGDMFLNQNVVVVSTDGSRLTTDWLHYRKKNDVIVSSAPIKIVRPDSITEGIGMEATSDLSNLKIFNQTLVIPGKGE